MAKENIHAVKIGKMLLSYFSIICTDLMQIPTTAEYSSLNVSQAAMVCFYEVFLAADVYVPQEEKSGEAPSELRERMFEVLDHAQRVRVVVKAAVGGHRFA